MITKRCFSCGKEKPLSDYYAHPKMKDGHLNKCKECVKDSVRINSSLRAEDKEWREKQRARGREKYRRLGYKDKRKSDKYVEMSNVSRFYKNLGLTLQGCELHHWNYNFLKDVIALPISIHRKLHNLLQFDNESKCFFHNGVLLTSKQDHINLIKTIA